MSRIYDEIIDFIAAGTMPSNIAAFQPSETIKQRVAELIQREKTTGLSPEETSELDHYLQIEHLMRLAKARARIAKSPYAGHPKSPFYKGGLYLTGCRRYQHVPPFEKGGLGGIYDKSSQ